MRLVVAVFALALSASVGSAGGINLMWNDCYYYGYGGAVNRSFACDTNAGTNELFVSFDPPTDIYDVAGTNATIDLQSASIPLPAWWQFKNVASCRMTSLTAAHAFTGNCIDPWFGQSAGGIVSYLVAAVSPSMPPNRARIITTNSVPTPLIAQVYPGNEYVGALVRIDNNRTVGTACSGCLDPVCLVLNELSLFGERSGYFRLTNPLVSNFVTWQGGSVGGAGCPAATPALNRTWGQLKSVYR